MKVLNISLDKKLFSENSDTRRRVLDYAQLFERFDLIVLTPRGYSNFEFGNMVITPTNSFSKPCYLKDVYLLGKNLIKKYKHDAISAQDPFEMGFVAWLLARKYKSKLQIQVHGDYFGSNYWRRESLLNNIRYYLGKWVIKKADSVRVVSERIKSSVIDLGIAEKKITVVPIYTHVYTHAVTDTKTGKFIFLTAGRLVPLKNVDMQIEAMKEIAETHPEIELWVVGDGPEINKLKVESEKLKVEKNIKFFGWKNNLEEFYKQADAFLLTSNYEGWGLVAIEAASYGLPIIMTDVGCAGEIIKNEESGIIIEMGNKEALIQAMLKLIKNKDLCEMLGENAKNAILVLPDKRQNMELYKKSFLI